MSVKIRKKKDLIQLNGEATNSKCNAFVKRESSSLWLETSFLSRMIDRLTWTAMTERTSTVILLNSSKQPHAPVWARPWTIYHYEWYCDTLWYIILHYSIALWYITMHNNLSLFHKIYHYAKLHDIAKRRSFQNCTLHNVLFVQYDGPVVFWLKP